MRVKFKISALREKIRENRGKHIQEYNDAKKDYERLALAALEKEIVNVKEGKRAGWGMPTYPSCHQDAYDTVLAMFDMTTETDVELDELSFKRYIKDEWEWTAAFKNTTASLKG